MTATELPAGYVETTEQLAVGAQIWLQRFGSEGLGLTLPPEGVMLVAPLQGDFLQLIATTPRGIAFLQYLDWRSEQKASLNQAIFVLRELSVPYAEWEPARLAALSRSGGST